jgi:hypothetical protein
MTSLMGSEPHYELDWVIEGHADYEPGAPIVLVREVRGTPDAVHALCSLPFSKAPEPIKRLLLRQMPDGYALDVASKFSQVAGGWMIFRLQRQQQSSVEADIAMIQALVDRIYSPGEYEVTCTEEGEMHYVNIRHVVLDVTLVRTSDPEPETAAILMLAGVCEAASITLKKGLV